MPEASHGVRPDFRGKGRLWRRASFTTSGVGSQLPWLLTSSGLPSRRLTSFLSDRGNPLFFAASAVKTNVQVKLLSAPIALHLPDECPRPDALRRQFDLEKFGVSRRDFASLREGADLPRLIHPKARANGFVLSTLDGELSICLSLAAHTGFENVYPPGRDSQGLRRTN